MTLELRPFGPTAMQLTPVGLGTWMMEGDPQTAKTSLRRGIDEGCNHIDTAEMYGSGRVEEIVGEALEGLRQKVSLVSKVLPVNAGYEGTIKACERSLKRLKTDHLDAYLLHWREDDTPLEDTFRAFEKLKTDGKIRAWGVSNFDVAEMEEAVGLAGEGKIACNQVLYFLEERAIEFDLVPWCRQHQVAVVAYSPFSQGRLPSHPVLDALAKSHGATPAQVILSFLTRESSVFTIPKSSSVEHTVENIRSMGVKLTEDDIRRLDKAFPAQRRKTLPTI